MSSFQRDGQFEGQNAKQPGVNQLMKLQKSSMEWIVVYACCKSTLLRV
jgi:hypothetical protein